jgi:hypothetical protein
MLVQECEHELRVASLSMRLINRYEKNDHATNDLNIDTVPNKTILGFAGGVLWPYEWP